MKDLNRLMTRKLACSILFTPSDKESAEYLFKTIDGSITQDNAIGRMLHGSEEFLEILQYLNQLPLASSLFTDEVARKRCVRLSQPLPRDRGIAGTNRGRAGRGEMEYFIAISRQDEASCIDATFFIIVRSSRRLFAHKMAKHKRSIDPYHPELLHLPAESLRNSLPLHTPLTRMLSIVNT